MGAVCVRHTDLPLTSKLFADYVYHFDRVARFYDYDPHSAESFGAAASRVEISAEGRERLAGALRQQNGEHPGIAALANGAFAVVTGQQVGLFSGPLYTIFKALTAAALAERLSASGLPCVPVFWLATEDHDFGEVNHCWVFDGANRPVRIEVAAGGIARRPVGEIPLPEPPIGELRRALSDLPFGNEVADLAAGCYAPGETMGSGFANLLRKLVPSLVLFDPMHPSSRALAAPLIRKAVEAMPDLLPAVLTRNEELAAAGYHAQVHLEEQMSLVFLLEGGERIAMRRNGSAYHANGREWDAGELADRAESLSPNALLRPVVQDAMLPSVAYVGGPAELAYLAQSQVLYRALLGRMPVAVPRQGGTLLDARAAKLFARYGLSLTDFIHGEEPLKERIACMLVPVHLEETLAGGKARVSEALDEMGTALAGFDHSLEAAFAKSRRKIEYQLTKTERKTARAAMAKNERAAADASYLNCLVHPHKHLQERFYSILPFMARHGMDVVERLADEIKPECLDHRLITL